MHLLTIVIGACAVLAAAAETGNPNAASAAGSQVADAQAAPHSEVDTRQYIGIPGYPRPPYRPNRRCPLCDSSVYPYCGEKLFHDACCCADPYMSDLPYQCRLADCRFLHANSCREHRMIANCCCSDDYRMILRSIGGDTKSVVEASRSA